MTSYRLFPSTDGPATATSYGGNFQAALVFGVTSISWLEGYWWWVCGSGGQSTGPQKFALWQVYGSGKGSVIADSVVTSGALQAGWNWVPLPKPIPLSVANDPAKAQGDGAAVYIATTAFSGPFPITPGQFGAGATYAGGITQGPLVAYSDLTGSAKSPGIDGGFQQGEFGVASSDPTASLPLNNSSGSSNFWMDVQVSDGVPSGYTGPFRLFPNLPTIWAVEETIDTQQQTMGTQFALSQPCSLDKVWFYSPPFVQALPTSTQVWNVNTQQIVAQTQAATWASATGASPVLASGWVYDSYASQQVTLPAGEYVVTVYYAGGSTFYLENRGYYSGDYGDEYKGTVGPAPEGLVNGPLSSPPNAKAFGAPTLGNTCYIVTTNSGPTFPSDWDRMDDGENRWVDVEVSLADSTQQPPPPPARQPGVPLTFFP